MEIPFNDKYWRLINIGDWVVYLTKCCNGMDIQIGKVVGFTDKKVKIKDITFEYSDSKDTLVWIDPSNDDGKYTTLRNPDQCIDLRYNSDDLIGKCYSKYE